MLKADWKRNPINGIILQLLIAIYDNLWEFSNADWNIGKTWVIVLTDISNEPDDEQSMVLFLCYTNEFNVEGLVATTSR